MSKGLKITLLILSVYLGITALHLRLNVGLDALGLGGSEGAANTFRVGFLPVT